MYVIYIIKILILVYNIQGFLSTDNTKLPDKRSCANAECSVPISEARTLLNFASPTNGLLSFKANQRVVIFSKEAGDNTNLWGAEIDGKRGFVPKNLVREDKILFKGNLSFLQNVEITNSEIKPDSVKEAYEVIEGTTVYTGSSEEALIVENISDLPPVVSSTGEAQENLIKSTLESQKSDVIENNNQIDAEKLNLTNKNTSDSRLNLARNKTEASSHVDYFLNILNTRKFNNIAKNDQNLIDNNLKSTEKEENFNSTAEILKNNSLNSELEIDKKSEMVKLFAENAKFTEKLSMELTEVNIPPELNQIDLAEEKQEILDLINNLDDDISLNTVKSNLEEFVTTEKPIEPKKSLFSNIFSYLFTNSTENLINIEENLQNNKETSVKNNFNQQQQSLYGQDYLLSNFDRLSCSADAKKTLKNVRSVEEIINSLIDLDFAVFPDVILVVSITGGFTLVLFLGYVLIDKNRRERPLIAKINNLEKALLVSQKENILLTELHTTQSTDTTSTVEIAQLQRELNQSLTHQHNLHAQIQSLEKELENSTEVGLELNKMISDMLSAHNSNDVLTTHVEQLQNQLVDQHNDITKYKQLLNTQTTDNRDLQQQHDINQKQLHNLQTDIDSMLLTVLQVEEERDNNKRKHEHTITDLRKDAIKLNADIQRLHADLRTANELNAELSRSLAVKLTEFDLLADSLKAMRNSESIKELLDVSSVKAELQQLMGENVVLRDSLKVEQDRVYTFEKQAEIAIQETQRLKGRFDETDRERVEAQTKLDVLGGYFREKEGQLLKEINKYEAMWNEKQGEASSTIERIKFMQEELQNYKSQNETLKHEIMSQEVDFKSQISVLEKKSHEYWLNARQVERKLDDARQEAAQLRNRLTLQERTYLSDDKTNGIPDHAQQLTPLRHAGGLDKSETGLIVGGNSTASPPPIMYPDHVTSSAHNLHSLPPPFLPPPPFMAMNGPPPPMFMHPLPPPPPPQSLTQGTGVSMFGPPGDHRPPPLGRISSPPPQLPDRARDRATICYSPGPSYSPYDDRRTPPSPSYDDDDDDDDLDDIYNRHRGGHRRYYANNYATRQVESPPPMYRNTGAAKNGTKGSMLSSGGPTNSTASTEKGNSGQYHHHNTNV